ncbi:MAG: hypothetical protein JO246_03175 [Frankiaceae bacterium]|nr:hypothetical protein [Frankiaceae bacterium]MBV9870422.1 hypothetical protein [Frankiaceae bacterium]
MFTTTTSRRLGLIAGAGVIAAVTGTLGIATATPERAHHTIRLTSVQLRDTIIKGVDVATDRDVSHGQTVGYDVTSCQVDPASHTAKCDVAMARSDGMLRGRATIDVNTGTGTGRITGGTRTYQGVSGSLSVAPGASQGRVKITISYHS